MLQTIICLFVIQSIVLQNGSIQFANATSLKQKSLANLSPQEEEIIQKQIDEETYDQTEYFNNEIQKPKIATKDQTQNQKQIRSENSKKLENQKQKLAIKQKDMIQIKQNLQQNITQNNQSLNITKLQQLFNKTSLIITNQSNFSIQKKQDLQLTLKQKLIEKKKEEDSFFDEDNEDNFKKSKLSDIMQVQVDSPKNLQKLSKKVDQFDEIDQKLINAAAQTKKKDKSLNLGDIINSGSQDKDEQSMLNDIGGGEDEFGIADKNQHDSFDKQMQDAQDNQDTPEEDEKSDSEEVEESNSEQNQLVTKIKQIFQSDKSIQSKIKEFTIDVCLPNVLKEEPDMYQLTYDNDLVPEICLYHALNFIKRIPSPKENQSIDLLFGFRNKYQFLQLANQQLQNQNNSFKCETALQQLYEDNIEGRELDGLIPFQEKYLGNKFINVYKYFCNQPNLTQVINNTKLFPVTKMYEIGISLQQKLEKVASYDQCRDFQARKQGTKIYCKKLFADLKKQGHKFYLWTPNQVKKACDSINENDESSLSKSNDQCTIINEHVHNKYKDFQNKLLLKIKGYAENKIEKIRAKQQKIMQILQSDSQINNNQANQINNKLNQKDIENLQSANKVFQDACEFCQANKDSSTEFINLEQQCKNKIKISSESDKQTYKQAQVMKDSLDKFLQKGKDQLNDCLKNPQCQQGMSAEDKNMANKINKFLEQLKTINLTNESPEIQPNQVFQQSKQILQETCDFCLKNKDSSFESQKVSEECTKQEESSNFDDQSNNKKNALVQFLQKGQDQLNQCLYNSQCANGMSKDDKNMATQIQQYLTQLNQITFQKKKDQKQQKSEQNNQEKIQEKDQQKKEMEQEVSQDLEKKKKAKKKAKEKALQLIKQKIAEKKENLLKQKQIKERLEERKQQRDENDLLRKQVEILTNQNNEQQMKLQILTQNNYHLTNELHNFAQQQDELLKDQVQQAINQAIPSIIQTQVQTIADLINKQRINQQSKQSIQDQQVTYAIQSLTQEMSNFMNQTIQFMTNSVKQRSDSNPNTKQQKDELEVPLSSLSQLQNKRQKVVHLAQTKSDSKLLDILHEKGLLKGLDDQEEWSETDDQDLQSTDFQL